MLYAKDIGMKAPAKVLSSLLMVVSCAAKKLITTCIAQDAQMATIL